MILLFSGGKDSALLAIEHLDRISILMHFMYDHPTQLQEAYAVNSIYRLLKSKKPDLALVVYRIPIQAQSMYIGTGERGYRVVPCRNAIMLSMAANYALSHDLNSIMFGANADDHTGYEDCRPDYIKSMSDLMGVKIETPLIGLTKKTISERMVQHAEIDQLSWSCYEPDNGQPCLKCDSCIANSG